MQLQNYPHMGKRSLAGSFDHPILQNVISQVLSYSSVRVTILHFMSSNQWRSKLNNWGGGGHIFIYSCSAQLISFEIDCFHGLWTRIYEYVPPPNYRVCYATASNECNLHNRLTIPWRDISRRFLPLNLWALPSSMATRRLPTTAISNVLSCIL